MVLTTRRTTTLPSCHDRTRSPALMSRMGTGPFGVETGVLPGKHSSAVKSLKKPGVLRTI
jgi:hypothetical protein